MNLKLSVISYTCYGGLLQHALKLLKVIWVGWTHVCYVIKTAEDVLSGLFRFKSGLLLMLLCRLEEQKYQVNKNPDKVGAMWFQFCMNIF